ncbi:lysylphosphatidylglycerol synthase transmembrane domain-containing protein [Sulfurimonas sp.]|uniref:lysylphosphatidylglycerol synthase transmembrane domain-containing protein n=1 Tax=Sulfurimonas sp. TaxID=2022749 RepID=UPI002AB249F1|nr:lysylphosphatidylglycerol synthase transmembrane domain-containing protein [Sulfurimonas sp.]
MKNIIKLLITIIIFYYLFQYIDFNELKNVLAKSHGGTILIALLLQLASTYLAAYRWRAISELLVFKEKLSFYVNSYFKGAFFNQVLPSSIGGDAVRIIDLTRKGYEKKDAFYGVFVDRVVGLVGLLVLNLLASIIFFGTFEKDFSLLVIFISSSGIAGFALLFHLDKITFLSKYKGLDLFYRLARRLNTLYADRTLLYKHISISVGVHLLSVLVLFALADSININMNLQTFLIAVPPVFLLTIIPLSLAGWGIREGAMVGIFMLVGADETKILAMSILYGILLIIASFPGSYQWIKSKKAT